MGAAGGADLAHREAVLTVMFTDIIGFTSLSETMAPGDVAAFLNRHFNSVNQCIEAEDGTLDKYIGDAAMAFWGAPEPDPEHAARACRAALKLLEAATRRLASGDRPPVRIKIAIHTGPLLVGNIGAEGRMNYTVIGDTVNVASRIEAVCSAEDDGAPAIILVSGETVQAAGPGFNFEPLGAHSVPGRHEAVDVWRLWP
jgi:class 3 adenylate cyclase